MSGQSQQNLIRRCTFKGGSEGAAPCNQIHPGTVLEVYYRAHDFEPMTEVQQTSSESR